MQVLSYPVRLGIRDYDLGVVLSLGGKLKNVNPPYYYIRVSGLKSSSGADMDEVIVYQTIVEQADIFKRYKIPSVIIHRAVVEFNSERWSPPSLWYRLPAVGARQEVIDGEMGYDMYEQDIFPVPMDIRYVVSVIARTIGDANILLNHVLRRILFRSNIFYVKDRDDRLHSFDAEIVGVENISNLIDVSEKLIGFSVDWVVHGELPLTDPYITKSVFVVDSQLKNIKHNVMILKNKV